MTYDNTNRGALFKNDRKQKENHPDYTGKIDVNGTEYQLSGWIKQGKKGKFLSLSVKPAQERREPASRNTPVDLGDEVPW